MKEAGELPSESGEAHSRQREQLELKILRCSACSKNSKRTACSSEVSGRGMGLPEDKVKEVRVEVRSKSCGIIWVNFGFFYE